LGELLADAEADYAVGKVAGIEDGIEIVAGEYPVWLTR